MRSGRQTKQASRLAGHKAEVEVLKTRSCDMRTQEATENDNASRLRARKKCPRACHSARPGWTNISDSVAQAQLRMLLSGDKGDNSFAPDRISKGRLERMCGDLHLVKLN